ncbi:hypothetical protein ACFXGD_21390 [Streptomyces albidoflavus]
MSSTARTDVPLAVHAAREGDGYWKSKGIQWQLLCPHMSSTAKVALGILCSLTGQTHPVRKLTATELAGLLSKGPVAPGEAPKGMSTSGAIRVLRELADLGSLTRPDGTRLTISSRPTAELSICVWTRPRHDCGCARNAHDALNALRGEDTWFPPAGTGQNSDHASESGENSDQSGENSDQPGQNSAKTPPLTCDDAPPLSSSPSFPSLSEAPAVAEEANAPARPGSTDEREKRAAPNDEQAERHEERGQTSPAESAGGASEAERSADEGRFVAAALAAEWRTLHGTAPGRQQLEVVTRQADEAIADGDNSEWLIKTVAPFMASRRYLDLGRARTHRACPPPRSAAGAVGAAGAPERCPDHPARRRRNCVECALAVPA